MPETALGRLLRDLREERGLTLRETAQLADVDHAYIHRLETGVKESPSDEVLAKLARALKAPKREMEMLRYLAAHPLADPGLAAYVHRHPTITYKVFAAAASAAYRGAARPDYGKHIERVRRILDDDDSG